MKYLLPTLSLLLATGMTTLHANPEVPIAVAATFGNNVAENIILLKGTGTTADPIEWAVYSQDSFRPGEVLRIRVQQDALAWKAAAAGAGSDILDPAPTRLINFARVLVRSADARIVAAKSAALAQTTFVSIDYQLAANSETGAPEWGMALKDETGYEVGFVVVSAETGAVGFQDWSPRVTNLDESDEGERAARAVKRGARKAWNWTDNARKETRGFFKELFR